MLQQSFFLLLLLLELSRSAVSCSGDAVLRFDFASVGVALPTQSRTKVVCDVRVAVLAPANATLFYVSRLGVGMGEEAPANLTSAFSNNGNNNSAGDQRRNVIELAFNTRVQLVRLNLTALFNVSLNASLEFVFGPLTDDEQARGVTAPRVNRVETIQGDDGGGGGVWQPPPGAPPHCLAVYVRGGSSMPDGTLIFQGVEVRPLGLNITLPDEVPLFGDTFEPFGGERVRINGTRTRTPGGTAAPDDIWSSWVPWVAIGGCLIVLCVCGLLIFFLRKRVASLKEKNADDFFTQVELEKAQH